MTPISHHMSLALEMRRHAQEVESSMKNAIATKVPLEERMETNSIDILSRCQLNILKLAMFPTLVLKNISIAHPRK